MRPEDMGTARGNCGFLDVSTILSKDSKLMALALVSTMAAAVLFQPANGPASQTVRSATSVPHRASIG